MGDINQAFNLIVQACNDPNIGYSQADRYSITLNVPYITHCDCSSILSWALSKSGFFSDPTWCTTVTIGPHLEQAGWSKHRADSVNWEAGDIVWKHGHCEMVYESRGIGGVTMGAHSENEGSFAEQVSIRSWAASASRYEYIYKSGSSATGSHTWFQPENNEQRYLTSDEMYENAIMINAFLQPKGYSRAAIAAMLGNMEAESTLNPNIWQGLIIGTTGGYGLVQWTPASKYRDWATSKGYAFSDATQNGNGQMEWLYEMPQGEWLPSVTHPEYHYTYDQFKQLDMIEEAVKTWLWQFERASAEVVPKRIELANKWYVEIPNFPSDVGNPPPSIKGAAIDCELRRRLVKPR